MRSQPIQLNHSALPLGQPRAQRSARLPASRSAVPPYAPLLPLAPQRQEPSANPAQLRLSPFPGGPSRSRPLRTALRRSVSGRSGLRRSHLEAAAMFARPLLLPHAGGGLRKGDEALRGLPEAAGPCWKKAPPSPPRLRTEGVPGLAARRCGRSYPPPPAGGWAVDRALAHARTWRR